MAGFMLKIAAIILSSYQEVASIPGHACPCKAVRCRRSGSSFQCAMCCFSPCAPSHSLKLPQCCSEVMLAQVLFLDSDNVAIDDIGQLFATPEYVRFGALLWPDYWDNSAAPDLLRILALQTPPHGTTESGQMVFDKARLDT